MLCLCILFKIHAHSPNFLRNTALELEKCIFLTVKNSLVIFLQLERSSKTILKTKNKNTLKVTTLTDFTSCKSIHYTLRVVKSYLYMHLCMCTMK